MLKRQLLHIFVYFCHALTDLDVAVDLHQKAKARGRLVLGSWLEAQLCTASRLDTHGASSMQWVVEGGKEGRQGHPLGGKPK